MALPRIGTTAAMEVKLEATFTASQKARAGAILDDISALARKESGDSERWVTTDDPPVSDAPADVAAIVVRAAVRDYRNPAGFASEQDGDYSYRLDSDNLPSGGGVFTESELRTLNSYQETSGLWAQKITGGPDTTRTNAGLLERVWDATFAE